MCCECCIARFNLEACKYKPCTTFADLCCSDVIPESWSLWVGSCWKTWPNTTASLFQPWDAELLHHIPMPQAMSYWRLFMMHTPYPHGMKTMAASVMKVCLWWRRKWVWNVSKFVGWVFGISQHYNWGLCSSGMSLDLTNLEDETSFCLEMSGTNH
jgi:hypothetical protein